MLRLALLFILASGAYAQNSTADQIVLPADKTDADVTLTLALTFLQKGRRSPYCRSRMRAGSAFRRSRLSTGSK